MSFLEKKNYPNPPSGSKDIIYHWFDKIQPSLTIFKFKRDNICIIIKLWESLLRISVLSSNWENHFFRSLYYHQTGGITSTNLCIIFKLRKSLLQISVLSSNWGGSLLQISVLSPNWGNKVFRSLYYHQTGESLLQISIIFKLRKSHLRSLYYHQTGGITSSDLSIIIKLGESLLQISVLSSN